MTVTVSTSIDPAGGGAAAVTVDVTSAVQAARAFAAQAQQYLFDAQTQAQIAQQYATDAQAALDQAQGLYSLTISKVASQLGVAGLTAVAQMLPTTQPAQTGVLWNNGGVIELT